MIWYWYAVVNQAHRVLDWLSAHGEEILVTVAMVCVLLAGLYLLLVLGLPR